MTEKVEHGHEMVLGSLKIRCLSTPCHTKGHICYLVTSPGQTPVVFTGNLFFANSDHFQNRYSGDPKIEHSKTGNIKKLKFLCPCVKTYESRFPPSLNEDKVTISFDKLINTIVYLPLEVITLSVTCSKQK